MTSIILFCSMLGLSAFTLLRYSLRSETSPASQPRVGSEEARRALQTAAALAPRARIVVMPRDWTDSEQEAAVAPPEEDRASTILALRRQGDRAFAKRDMGEAERLYAHILELEHENPRAAYGLARVRLSQGKLSGAEGWIQVAIRKRPRRASYRALHAEILTRLGRDEEALEERLRAASGVQTD